MHIVFAKNPEHWTIFD